MHELYLFKIAIIGDSLVGKTSITQAFLSGGIQFSRSYSMTSDVSLSVKDIFVQENKDAVELLIYDSAGNPLYVDFLPKFWSGINAVFAVFDVTSENSFESLKNWVKTARSVEEPPLDQTSIDYSYPGVIFANKVDLEGRRVVNSDRGRALATQLGFEYFEGSAKNNIEVEEAFTFLAKELHKISIENKM